MKISPTMLRQIIQEVIDEESLTEGIQDKRFEEFEDDVMEIGSDGGGQVEIRDLITRLSDKYNPDEIQNMISILVDDGALTQLGDSEFFSIPDDRKAWQDDEPEWADTSVQGGISQQQYSDDLAMQGGPWYYEGDDEDDTHWGADTEMTVGGTKYHSKKGDDEDMYDYEEEDFLSTASPEEVIARYSKDTNEDPNRPDGYNLDLVKTHRGALDVTVNLSDKEIEAAGPEKWDEWASQIRQAKNIVALGENIEEIIKEETAAYLKDANKPFVVKIS